VAGFWKAGFGSDMVEETQGDVKRRNCPWMYSLRQKQKKKRKKYVIFDYI
jgi:hypothetical protein